VIVTGEDTAGAYALVGTFRTVRTYVPTKKRRSM
jgi:hypothetical protein